MPSYHIIFALACVCCPKLEVAQLREMALSAAAETMARSAPHPVSEQVFRVRGGTLEPIND